MSFYEPQGWQAPVRQASWEQPAPPSRSGTSSTSQRDESNAFASQYEEIDRVIDNLVKSGKFFGGGPRREPMQSMGGQRHFNDSNPRMHGARHSVELDPARSGSAGNLQNFYANQRYQGRQTEAEQMLQAKRRMAAQRERELRNYHQEQQYNRSVLAEMSSSSNKSDRSMSPSALSEEGRRELIARQHRALYGNETPGFLSQGGFSEDGNSPSGNIPTSSAGGVRGNSPRGMDPFGMPNQSTQGDANVPGISSSQEINRGEKSSSPATGGNQQKAPTPPSGEEGHSRQISKSTTAPVGGGMGPIGSRPSTQGQAPNPALNKRSTTPLPSPLNYGFGGANEQSNADRTGSSNSNANNNNNNNQKDSNAGGSGMGAWGTGSGVWGSSKIGATSVWG